MDRIYDTSDGVREGENYDIYLIAGYHHSHAPLATHALERGGWAVVEKPLVTDRKQLAALLSALRTAPGRYFAGFNMRYSPLWELARTDLNAKPGDPIHSHCIVFELPLPRRHWYNWPNSGSRIISNACHWLDHFLFMNDWSPPVRSCVWRPTRVDDIHISVELENGAALNMSLTDTGSRRIGVQDHVQLRVGDATVRVDNGCRYESEAGYRILRRKRIPRLLAFERMYQTISRRILAGQPGDSLESTERSCRLMLDLEDQYQEISAKRSGVESK